MTRRVLVCFALATLAVPPLGARQHAGSYTPADVEAGARLYGAQCSVCHGADGTLVAAVDLRRGVFRFGSTDEELGRTITSGIPGTAMVPQTFSAQDLHALIAYIRSMRDFGSRAVTLGDAAKGAALIEAKGCLGCHRVNAKGSIFAADLSDIGTLRSAELLLRALTEPTGVVPAGRRFIRAVTTDGRTVSGRRVNEDTFTVQLVDDRGTLVSLVKAELREYSVTRTFPLPPAKTALTPAERADLAAYLTTLTTAPSRR
jgi:putative heme-binding domain-containing protein